MCHGLLWTLWLQCMSSRNFSKIFKHTNFNISPKFITLFSDKSVCTFLVLSLQAQCRRVERVYVGNDGI